jgi:hypothetical protein
MSKMSAEELLEEEIKVINIGLQEFYGALLLQRVKVLHVDWRPPAQGDEEMLELLSRLL